MAKTENVPLSPQLFCARISNFTCNLESFRSFSRKNQIMPVPGDCADINIMAPCLASDRRALKPLKSGKRDIFHPLLSAGDFEIIQAII